MVLVRYCFWNFSTRFFGRVLGISKQKKNLTFFDGVYTASMKQGQVVNSRFYRQIKLTTSVIKKYFCSRCFMPPLSDKALEIASYWCRVAGRRTSLARHDGPWRHAPTGDVAIGDNGHFARKLQLTVLYVFIRQRRAPLSALTAAADKFRFIQIIAVRDRMPRYFLSGRRWRWINNGGPL